jgi:predicted amidohydrolase
MADALRVGVVQMSSQDDVPKNLARAVELVDRAGAEGAKVVVLPGNFATGGRGGRSPTSRSSGGATRNTHWLTSVQ